MQANATTVKASPSVTTSDWKTELNTRNNSHESFRVHSPQGTLYIKGAASNGAGRVVSHGEIPAETNLADRKALTIYQDMHHTFIKLHQPEDGQQTGAVDTVVGKYARNNGPIKLATSMQDAAAAMPGFLRYTLGLGMVCFSKFLMAGRLLWPHQASINDEPRLYQQFGQDYHHHPHVTFLLDDDKAKELNTWISDLHTRSKRQEFPLTFQLTGNNCSAFAHDAFAKAGYPGSFIDYFDEDALRSRSLGAVTNTRDVHGYRAAVTRLYRNFIEPWVQWKPYVVYQPDISPTYVTDLFKKAQTALAQSQEAAGKLKALAPAPTGICATITTWLCSGSLLSTAEMLQKSKRFKEASDTLSKQLALLETRMKELEKNASKEQQATLITELHGVTAIADKITFKAKNSKNKEKKEK